MTIAERGSIVPLPPSSNLTPPLPPLGPHQRQEDRAAVDIVCPTTKIVVDVIGDDG